MEENNTNVTNPQSEPQANAGNEPQSNPSNEPEVTLESLMKEVAQLKVSEAKNKKELDKALKEKADAIRMYRETLSDAQKAEIAQQEQDEERKQYVSDLEAYKQRNEALKRYMTVQGMSAELAEKAAEAEISGDMETLAEVQKQHSDSLLKAAKDEWRGSIPDPQFSSGESSMTREQILAIKDSKQRQRAIANNLALFS
jgi:hypothetical protein